MPINKTIVYSKFLLVNFKFTFMLKTVKIVSNILSFFKINSKCDEDDETTLLNNETYEKNVYTYC